MKFDTERLIIRSAGDSDVSAIVKYIGLNKKFHAPYVSKVEDDFFTEEYWNKKIDKVIEDTKNDEAYRFYIFKKEDEGKIIGSISFTNIQRGPFQACNLGYLLDESEQGHGYMTEALSAAIQYAFRELNFHRIMANYIPQNKKSEKVLKKLGFIREGVSKDYLLLEGKWKDHILTSLVNHKWKNA